MEEKVRNLIYIEDNIAYQKCYSFEKEQVVSHIVDLTAKDSIATDFLWQLNHISEHATNEIDDSPEIFGLPIIFSSKGIIQINGFSHLNDEVISELKLIKQKANNSAIKNTKRMVELCEELFPYMNYELAKEKESFKQDENYAYFLEKHQEICQGMITVSDEEFAEFYDVYSAVLQPLKPYNYEERVKDLKKKYSK